MKLKINSKELQKALNTVAPAIPSRSIIPINECVLINANEIECEITGTNSNLTIETSVPIAGVDKNGMICANFQELKAIASRLEGEITIEDVGGQIVVTNKKKTWKCGKSIDAANFSKGKRFVPEWSISLESEALYYMEKALSFTEPKSPILRWQDVWVNIYDGKLDIAASDGATSMFRYQSQTDTTLSFKGLVNHTFVRAAARLEGNIDLESDGRFLMAKTPTTSVWVTMSVDNIPAYEKFYNSPKEVNLEVNRADFLAAIEDIFVYSPVDTQPPIVKLLFPKGGISVNYSQSETNKDYETTVEAKHDIKIEKMYFIAAKLKNILSSFPSTTDTIKFCIKEGEPTFIMSDEDPLTLSLNALVYNN